MITTRKAVSNQSHSALLWSDANLLGCSSLAQDNAQVFSDAFSRNKVRSLEIKTIVLDDFFRKIGNNKIDVIKVDTQGAEGLVLDGAKEILKSNNLVMFMEFWPMGIKNTSVSPFKLLKSLKEYGFKMYIIDEKNEKLILINDLRKTARSLDELNLFLTKLPA